MSARNIPDGFKRRDSGPFTTKNGPFHLKKTPDGLVQGLRITKDHCNMSGIVHGGMLLTMADSIMGVSVYNALGARGLTVQMNAQFIAAVRAGDWLEARAHVRRATRALIFCDAELHVGETLVMTASSVYRRVAQQA